MNLGWYFMDFLFCSLNSGECSMVLNWGDWVTNKVWSVNYSFFFAWLTERERGIRGFTTIRGVTLNLWFMQPPSPLSLSHSIMPVIDIQVLQCKSTEFTQVSQMIINWSIWIHKMWHMHIIEYYLATKGTEVLIHDIPSMNLENMLTKRSQTRRPRIIWFCFYKMSRLDKSIET